MQILADTFPAAGKFHLPDYQDNAFHELNMPLLISSSGRCSGILTAFTIGDIDDGNDFELVVNNVSASFAAYDLLGRPGPESSGNRGGTNSLAISMEVEGRWRPSCRRCYMENERYFH